MIVMQDIVYRSVSKEDKDKIVSFLSEVFGVPYSHTLWEWKYKDHNLGTYAVIADYKSNIIGHYGALPRKMLYKGEEVLSGLICDVAVAPKFRGILRKRGVFYNLVQTFKNLYVSEKRRIFKMCYGFPTTRARKVALKLELYEDVEPIYHFIFELKKIRMPIWDKLLYKKAEYKKEPPSKIVDTLWKKMANSFKSIFGNDFILNKRDSSYLSWRIKQPNLNIKAIVIFTFNKPSALFLIAQKKEKILLYDYIGDIRVLGKNIKLLLSLIKIKEIEARFPIWIKQFFKELDFNFYKTDIVLVGNKLTGPYASDIRGKFFYTFADEDV